MQAEFDLAGLVTQRLEAPAAVELAKWAVDQGHFYQLRRVRAVFGREALFDSTKIDGDGGADDVTFAPEDFGAAAPRQELGIGRHVFHQRVHLRGGVLYQHGFFHQRH